MVLMDTSFPFLEFLEVSNAFPFSKIFALSISSKFASKISSLGLFFKESQYLTEYN